MKYKKIRKKIESGSVLTNLDEPKRGGGGCYSPGERGGNVRRLRTKARPQKLEQSWSRSYWSSRHELSIQKLDKISNDEQTLDSHEDESKMRQIKNEDL